MYDFWVNALLAGTIIAVVAGPVGYMLVLRNQAFAGHALSHVGFTGATGAVLLGVSPLWGFVLLTMAAGVVMGRLGARAAERDVAIGVVLTVALGFGLLFLHFYTAYATQATSLLFGNILGIDAETIWTLLALGAVCLVGLGAMFRPLLFASLQPELAEARGVRLDVVSMAFMALVGLAVAECAQIVGVLLTFALLVGPAAAAQRWTGRVGAGIGLATVLAVGETWAGLALSDVTDWPVSFWIAVLSGGAYLAACSRRGP